MVGGPAGYQGRGAIYSVAPDCADWIPAGASSVIVRASHDGGMEGALDTSDPYSRPEAALSLVSAQLSYNYR